MVVQVHANTNSVAGHDDSDIQSKLGLSVVTSKVTGMDEDRGTETGPGTGTARARALAPRALAAR